VRLLVSSVRLWFRSFSTSLADILCPPVRLPLSDEEALQSDWEAVGNDIRAVWGRLQLSDGQEVEVDGNRGVSSQAANLDGIG
jgi:hypothetical protein